MITEKLQNEINGQITAELWSSNLYLSMSFYMEKEGYAGMAAWLKKQAEVQRRKHQHHKSDQVLPAEWKEMLDLFHKQYLISPHNGLGTESFPELL